MLKKNDLLLLLTELQLQGVDVNSQITTLMTSKEIPLSVVKFINSIRPLEVSNFYERLRQNYNKKKSNLYINIVKEVEDPQEVLTTLSALALQIILYSKHVENKPLFFEHVRAKEITTVLNNYYTTFDITEAIMLLRLIKCDCKALENAK